MFCISIFDIAGIQDFVFATKKTRENVGASFLLGRIFEGLLVEELQAAFPNAMANWRPAEEFGMLSSAPPPAEIVYIGGGNALVAFRSKKEAVELTRAFSRKVLGETGGGLSVAVAHHETNASNFIEDRKRLMQKLERKKFNMPHGIPLLGLAVTREGASDGLPAVGRGEGGDWISRPAFQKRHFAQEAQKSDALSKFAPEGFSFPVEFDKLGRNREGGESLLAVVHIDGNNMGKTIEKHIQEGDGSYQDAVSRVRKISARISEAFERTFCETVSLLASQETLEALQQKGIVLTENALPLRPLICAGDDVTFVCDGRIALSLTEAFLKRLSHEKTPDGKTFTACAGIAIVKPHFPFYRAYRLSEELCANAKKKAKPRAGEDAGSWFDFEIVYSGLPLNLNAYRTGKYSIPGLAPLPDSGTEKEYHLLARPYMVFGSEEHAKRSWAEAMKRLEHIKKWPRSKLKGLREALTISKEDSAAFYKECESREYLLDGRAKLFEGDRTEWFDVIDILDVFIPVSVPQKGGEKV